MNLQELIDQATEDSERWFPEVAHDLAFMSLAICGETGEMANLVKKIVRGSTDYQDSLPAIKSELVDVFVYLLMIAGVLNLDLEKAYEEKRTYNESRFGKKGS